MIKACLHELLPVCHKLFNSIFNLGTMPQIWWGGLITQTYKSGGRSDPANYRGICVSSCLSKLFCFILNQRCLEHVNSNNILHNSQPSSRSYILTYPASRGPSIFQDKSGRVRDLCQPTFPAEHALNSSVTEPCSASLELTCLPNDSRVHNKIF